MSRELRKLIAPLARRIRLTAARAVVSLVNDAAKMQGMQVKLISGEVSDNVERFQNYGFTSVPLSGAEGVFLSLNGSRDQGVLVVVDDRRHRKGGMQPGESAMHNHLGDYIHIKADGSIEVVASSKVTVTSPLVEMSGDLTVGGSIVAQGDISDHGDKSMAGMRGTYNTHTHPENNAPGGSTGTPNAGM